MSRLRLPTFHVRVRGKSIRRLLGTTGLCLALFAGVGTGTADEPPKPPAKKAEQPTRRSGTKVSGSSGRPKPKPRLPTGSRARRPDPRRKPPRTPPPRPATGEEGDESKAGDTGESLESDIDSDYQQMLKPAEERRYSISIEGTYADLLDAFSRMSGLAILGDTPAGQVSYVSTEEMDYEAALSRLRKILFSHPENFYIWREGNSLEIFRVTEAQRKMKPDRIYTDVHDFLDAGLDKMEIVLVLYTPEEGLVAELELLRDFMPDYVRIAPYGDKNAVTILALDRDVKKYLELITVFAPAADDPRRLKAIPLRHVLPSFAVQKLQLFMPTLSKSGPTPRPPRRGGKTPKGGKSGGSLQGLKGHGIDLVPYDEIRTLFVRAMPDKTAEIEEYLAIIDVEYGPGDDPTIVSLEHLRIEQLIPLLRPFYKGFTAPPAARGSKKKRRDAAGGAARAPAGSITTDAISIYPNPANNTLIVMADEEELTKLRMYISLFDIPNQNRTVRVALEHAEPEAILPLVEQIAQNRGLLNTAPLIQIDPAEEGFLLVADQQVIGLLREIIADLDRPLPGGGPSPHLYKCRNAAPSALVNLLNTLDRESTGAPLPSGKKGKRSSKARVRGGTKYHGDDATGTLYVICNDTEWNEHYLPLLETLDRAVESEITVVPIEHGEVTAVIDSVTRALGTRGKGAAMPTLMPHADGIMVLGATESDLAHIRRLVAEFDVDPEIERRTFTLRYADPAEVKAVLESLVIKGPDARPKPKSRGRGKSKSKGRGTSPLAVTTAGQVQIVETGRRELIVVAPPREMAEIAELIAELDIDPLDMTVEVYEFPPGSDVREIAQTLSSFYPGSTAVPIGESKGKKPKRGLQKTKPGDIRFIPHASALKILAFAPADLLPDIAEKVAMLRPEEPRPGQVFKFYPVAHLDPQEMADILEPLLEIEHQKLVDLGVIREKAPVGKGKGAAASPVSVMPDPLGDRVIVAGPTPLLDEVQPLIDQLDRPDRERVVKTITLERADPAEMVSAIQAMLSGRSASPRVPPRSKGGKAGKKGRRTSPRASPAGGEQGVTVVQAPGGSAVVVSGYADDVARVEEWIRELDDASAGGREVKIYTPQNVGVEDFADAVMTLVDSGGGAKPAKAKGDSLFDVYDPGGPRRGKDIYLVTDVWSDTVLISATPPKLREVDRLYEMYEGKPGEEPAIPPASTQPYNTYTLQHREDAWEAVYDLETILDALWPDPENKPKIDYIPFTKILTVRCPPDDFKRVKELITEYIDKPGEEEIGERGYKVIRVPGMTASDMARLLRARVGADKVHVMGLEEKDEGYGVEQVLPQPCVLPLCATRWMTTGAWGVADEPEEKPPAEEVNSPEFAREAKIKEEMLRSHAGPFETDGDAEATGAAAAGSETGQTTADEPAEPKPELTIAPDDERGVLVIDGTRQDVADLERVIEKILEELEEVPQLPDIRVFRLKYVDVHTASEILEAMFNAPRQRLTPQQMQAMRQAQRQQQRQQQQQQGQEEEKGRGRRSRQPEQPLPQVQQQPQEGQIRVHADARTRTLIIRAAPEQYPSIVKLLATIDKKGTAADFRIYPLKRLNAAEVEATLKEMLGVGTGARTARRTRQPQRGGRRATPQQPGQPTLELAALEGESIKGQITISSSPATNTIMAMAPEKTLDLIGELIEELEGQEAPPRVTKTYVLTHADPEEVVTKLDKLFGARGGRGGAGRDVGFDPMGVNQPKFIADARTNSLTVRALETDFPKIEPMIERFDQKAGDVSKPRFIKLQYAKPTEIARKLQEAFSGGGRGRGGRSKVQITGDDGSMQLIVVAPADVFADIQDMVSKIDIERTNLDFKVYALTHARAPEVLRQMTDLVRALIQRGRQTGVDLGVFSAVADEKTNSLVVAGEPTIFPIVESMLAKIDIPPAEPVAIETRVYRLVSAQANEVANTVNKLFGQRRGRSGEAPRAEANPATNTVIVRATKKEQDEIWEQVIKPLDEFAEAQAQEVYQLEHARASDIANTVNQTLRGKRGQPVVTVVANDPLNQLIITGNGKDVEKILPLIKRLDQEPLETSGVVVQVYNVDYVDPGSLERAIRSAFPDARGQAPEDRVRATYAWGTSSMVVTASQENHEKVKELIDRVDVESSVERTKHVVKLKAADAEDLAQRLTQVYRQTRRQRRDDVGMSITADPATNSLLINANNNEFEDVQELIAILDVKPEEQRDIRSFKLNYAECWELREAVTQLFSGGRGRRVSPRDRVDVYPNWASNTLVVAASPENMERIEAFITEVDQPGVGDRTVTVIKIENADAASVARALNDMFVRAARNRRGQQTISISNPQGSNTLLIRANEKELAEILAVINEIEATASAAGGEIKIIQLKYTDPEEVREILEEYLRKPGRAGGRRGGGADLVGDVRISVSAQNSALILSGDAEQLKEIGAVVAQLDVEMEDGCNVPKMIKLEHAQASQIQPQLEELFGQQRRGGGRSRRTTSAIVPVIVADDASNSLVVKACAAEYSAIEKLVAQLDSAEAGPNPVKIIPLQYTDAEEMQMILEEYLRQPASGGGRGRGRRGGTAALAGDVRISVSSQTNSLIISGPPAELERISGVVARIDVEVEGGGVQILKLAHAQASEIQPQLEEVFSQRGGGRRPGRGSSGAIQPVIVANDATNSLIVRASPADFKEIAGLVNRLDDEEAVGDPIRIVQVVPSVNVDDLAAKVEDTFNASSRARGGGRRGQQAQQLVVTSDKRTNSLILAGAPALFDDAEALIRALEKMGPQGGKRTIILRTENVDVNEIKGVIDDLIEDNQGSTRRSSRGSRPRGGGRRRR